MIDPDDEVVDLQLEDSAEEVVVETKPVEKLAEPDGIEQLRQQLEDAQKQRAEAETARRAAEERAGRLDREANDGRSSALTSQIQHLSSSIETVKSQAQMARRAYTEALQTGDYDKAGEMQEQIATLAAQKLQLENGKTHLEMQSKRPAPRQSGNPVEDMIQSNGIQGRAANWLRQHPECVTDEMSKNEMLAAHHRAIRSGLPEGSDEYFDYVDKRMGYVEDEKVEPAPRRAPAVSAPVTRRAEATIPRKSTEVKLTPFDLEMAANMKLTREEYAKGKLMAMREDQARSQR